MQISKIECGFKNKKSKTKMICTKCNKDKGTDFRKFRKVCRECDNATAREYRKTFKDKEKPDHIICSVCKEHKTEFRLNRKKCLDCERAFGRKYRSTTDKAKIWTENNREKMSELQHRWYEKEKPNIRERSNIRYMNDPNFRIAKNHRNSIRCLILNQQKSSKFLNCSKTRLLNWLQYQFVDDMSFENYGTVWVVDHVIPVNEFLSGAQPSEIVLNWINIQPVNPTKNLTKNKHIDKSQCSIHLENVKHYFKIRKIEEDKEYIRVLESHCSNILQDTLLREVPKAFEHHPRLETSIGEPG